MVNAHSFLYYSQGLFQSCPLEYGMHCSLPTNLSGKQQKTNCNNHVMMPSSDLHPEISLLGPPQWIQRTDLIESPGDVHARHHE